MTGVADERFQTSDLSQVAAIAREHGFCHVKGFFDPVQARAWEATELAVKPEDRVCDLLTLGHFNELLFEPRLLSIARALLGEQLVFYGETNCMVDSVDGYRTWHFDARGTPDNVLGLYEPTSAGRVYPSWRFAFYFRDYRQASGGLKVGPGSHKTRMAELKTIGSKLGQYRIGGQEMSIKMPAVPMYNIPSVAGDLIVFNLRTFHSGGYVRVIDSPGTAFFPMVEEALVKDFSAHIFPPPREPRNALIFDLAKPDPEFDLYPKWRVAELLRREQPVGWRRKVTDTEWGPSAYDRPEIAAVAERHGIALRYDRIIAQQIWKKRNAADRFTAQDQARLDRLLAINPEYSPYFPLRDHAA